MQQVVVSSHVKCSIVVGLGLGLGVSASLNPHSKF